MRWTGEEEKGPELLKKVVLAAIRDMLNKNTEVIDNTPAKILKNLGGKTTTEQELDFSKLS